MGPEASRFWWLHTGSVLSTTLVTCLWLLGHKKGIPYKKTMVAALRIYLKISFLRRASESLFLLCLLSSGLVKLILTEQGQHTDTARYA